jgi:DNA-binding MarR family transcriptional regulator
VTQLYDRRLHGAGIEASQFALLSVLDRMPGCSQAVQGRLLAMDKTTLSRNFKLLRRRGWIEPSPGKDERERGFRLTRAGRERLEAAKPLWKAVQERLQLIMGPRQWETSFKTLRALTQAAYAARQTD